MHEIQLLYVENIITRMKNAPQQELTFVMRVANLSHDKKVEVLWALVTAALGRVGGAEVVTVNW